MAPSRAAHELLPSPLADAAILVMQRDESELLPVWLAYHAALVGPAGITVVDHGSCEPTCLATLRQAEAQGVRVLRLDAAAVPLAAKGEQIAALIRGLAPAPALVLPLDADEFLGLRLADGTYSCEPDALAAWAGQLPPGAAFHSAERLNNCPWDPHLFWPLPADRSPKLCFTTTAVEGLDLGFHRCDQPSGGPVASHWVLFHIHNKPHPLLRDHALRKLLPRLPRPTSACLEAYSGPGDHLLPGLLQGERRWLRQLRRQPSRYTPAFARRLAQLGLPQPFAREQARLRRELSLSSTTSP
ncbi:MAG: glycosyltransferase family 2 protein [Cyanobacteriota bacterium]|nr:glycosyltransferase family 2 protein [Cyanobacteriota bacterium]